MAPAQAMTLINSDLLAKLLNLAPGGPPRGLEPHLDKMHRNEQNMQRVLNAPISKDRKAKLYDEQLGDYIDTSRKYKSRYTPHKKQQQQDTAVSGREHKLLNALSERGLRWTADGEVISDGAIVEGSNIHSIVKNLAGPFARQNSSIGTSEVANFIKKKNVGRTLIGNIALKKRLEKADRAARRARSISPVQAANEDDDDDEGDLTWLLEGGGERTLRSGRRLGTPASRGSGTLRGSRRH